MKAIVYDTFGPPEVLSLAEEKKPVPGEKEILIRVHAVPVNYGDVTARNFANIPARDFHMSRLLWLPARLSFGLKKPRRRIPGSEFSGVVEAVGRAVDYFQPGDAVMGYSGQRMGACAEYICVPAGGMVVHKPEKLSFAEAACLPYGWIMARDHLQKAGLRQGMKVLVNGASGGIGSLAVQLARHRGATVTGVCGGLRVEYVRSLGAARVIDYTREDFTKGKEKYDLVYDILGKSSFGRCRKVLKKNGIYLLASFKLGDILQMLGTAVFGEKKVICALASEKPEILEELVELGAAGRIKTVIDRTFPLDRAADAHRYYESGKRKGNVVILVNKETKN